MNRIHSRIQQSAAPGYAFLMFAVLLIVGQLLAMVDQPLRDLAHDALKLDLRTRGYDLRAVQILFDAYGAKGRTIYAWDLLVDMLYPLSQGITSILFISYVVRRPVLQKALIFFPVSFMALDFFENVLLLGLIWAYPAISSAVVNFASTLTVLKRYALLVSYFELFSFMLITIGILVVKLVRWLVKRQLRPA